MPKYTDEDIRNMSKITCKIAADYLGISPMAVSIGMRNDLLPIGFAIHNEERDRTYSESWSYHIIGERLIAYKYGKTSEVQVQNIEKSLNTIIEQFEEMKKDFTGLLFTNLVDFDAKWGHRRNVSGYADELEDFDLLLGQLLGVMDSDTLLIITADHGNDPTYKGTDHTRECVPCLMYSPSMKEHGILDDSSSFGVLGASVLDNFDLSKPSDLIGESILDLTK